MSSSTKKKAGKKRQRRRTGKCAGNLRKRQNKKGALGSVQTSPPIQHSNFLRLPEAVFVAGILPYVSDRDLVTSVPLLGKFFHKLCSECDSALWKQRCEKLWIGKVEASLAPFRSHARYKDRYINSLRDSHRRDITEDELCNLEWGFRFRAWAGVEMCSMDPYWELCYHDRQGKFRFVEPQNIMRRVFLRNHRLANPGPEDEIDRYLQDYGIRVKWKITKSRHGRRGCFVKVNHWPSAIPLRNPKTWGWIMYNEWVLYVSPPTIDHLLSLHSRFETC